MQAGRTAARAGRAGVQKRLKQFGLIAAALLLYSCPGTLDNPEDFGDGGICRKPLDVPNDLFLKTCADSICHDDTDPAGGLDLKTSDGLLGRLVGAQAFGCPERLRIDPSSPGDSLLLEKLSKDRPECGDRMPLGGKLSLDTIACVRDWIVEVSQNAPEAGASDTSTSNLDSGNASD